MNKIEIFFNFFLKLAPATADGLNLGSNKPNYVKIGRLKPEIWVYKGIASS
jgi:hypothetical protein